MAGSNWKKSWPYLPKSSKKRRFTAKERASYKRGAAQGFKDGFRSGVKWARSKKR